MLDIREMLTYRIVCGSRLACRLPFRQFASQPPTKTQPESGEAIKNEESSSDVEGHKPLYATKINYDRNVQAQRHQSVDAENGQRPTKWQRRFLVWTKLYKSQSEIPEIVAQGTMNRMHDRLRVLFIVTASFGFFSIFYIFEAYNFRRIQRDRAAGVVVTKI